MAVSATKTAGLSRTGKSRSLIVCTKQEGASQTAVTQISARAGKCDAGLGAVPQRTTTSPRPWQHHGVVLAALCRCPVVEAPPPPFPPLSMRHTLPSARVVSPSKAGCSRGACTTSNVGSSCLTHENGTSKGYKPCASRRTFHPRKPLVLERGD